LLKSPTSDIFDLAARSVVSLSPVEEIGQYQKSHYWF
jgi:hypothetical protein